MPTPENPKQPLEWEAKAWQLQSLIPLVVPKLATFSRSAGWEAPGASPAPQTCSWRLWLTFRDARMSLNPSGRLLNRFFCGFDGLTLEIHGFSPKSYPNPDCPTIREPQVGKHGKSEKSQKKRFSKPLAIFVQGLRARFPGTKLMF